MTTTTPTGTGTHRKGMRWIPRWDVRNGLRAALPGGGARPRGDGRRLLARRAPRHESRVHPLREGDRARDLGRGRARSRPVPRRAARAPLRRLGRLPALGRPGRPRPAVPVVVVDARSRLAAPARSRELAPRARAPSCRARRLRRRGGVRDVGGEGAADRGRVGVRGARRARGRRVRLGRRLPPEGPAAGEHLAGRVPVREHPARRLRGHLTRREVPAERLRPLRHDRERLGVDDRLVLGRRRRRLTLLRRRPPSRRASTRTTRPRSRVG